jgi:hypothetical protein
MRLKEALDLHHGKAEAPFHYYESVHETPDAAADAQYREAVARRETSSSPFA